MQVSGIPLPGMSYKAAEKQMARCEHRAERYLEERDQRYRGDNLQENHRGCRWSVSDGCFLRKFKRPTDRYARRIQGFERPTQREIVSYMASILIGFVM